MTARVSVLRALFLALTAVATASSCVGSGSATQGPTDECPVCKVEGDLACVRVRVTADTPSCTCDGAVVHFCSQDCRQTFLADPQRYSGR